jgi:hypothetical protein
MDVSYMKHVCPYIKIVEPPKPLAGRENDI